MKIDIYATKKMIIPSDFSQVFFFFVKSWLLLSPCSLHKSFTSTRLWREKNHVHTVVISYDEGSEVETLLHFNQ